MKIKRSFSLDRIVRVMLLTAILLALGVGVVWAAPKGPHPTQGDGFVGRSGKIDPDSDGNCGGIGDCNHRKIKVTEAPAPATEVPAEKTPVPGDPPTNNTPVSNNTPVPEEKVVEQIVKAAFAECQGYLEVRPQGRPAFRVPFKNEGEAALIHLSVANRGLVVVQAVVDTPVTSYTVGATTVEQLDPLAEYVYRPQPGRFEHQAEYDLSDGRRCLAGVEMQGK